jgi:hypothetical protein
MRKTEKNLLNRMKQVIGIIFLLLGFWIITIGAALMLNAIAKDQTFQWHGIFSIGLLLIGLTVVILGIVKIVKNSSKYLSSSQKLNQPNNRSIPPPVNNNKYEIIERLAKLKEQGVLTEEEFLEEKSKILRQI